MILVDTSMWIAIFNGDLKPPDDDLVNFVTAGPIVQEVLQGLREDRRGASLKELLMGVPLICDPLPLEVFIQAASIYRQARERGITIRSSVDCLIAAIALESGVPICHRDRDYTAIARFTPLRTWTPPWGGASTSIE